MIELEKRHTAEYLKKVIEKLLAAYDIRKEQLVSVTTDNGSNLLKLIKLLNSSDENSDIDDEDDDIDADDVQEISQPQSNENELHELSEDRIETIISDLAYENDLNNELADDDIYVEMLRDLAAEFVRDNIPFDIAGVRCAAHTTQLAVADAIQKSNVTCWIDLCRKVGKLFRTQNYQYEMNEQNLKGNVRIDCETRWNSTYIMVCTQTNQTSF